MIPKIIWQTHEWKYEDLPLNFRGTIKTWKNLNPEWEHRYVDAEQREKDIKEYNHILHRFYLLADKVTQADIWRYVITYTNGGVYADMDSVCFSPLDYIIENYYNNQDVMATPTFDLKSYKNIFTIDKNLNSNKTSNWQEYKKNLKNKMYVNNANFATIKNSKIMKIIIDNILDKYNKIKLVDVFDTWPEDGGAIGHIRLNPETYSNVVIKNKEIVSFDFNVAIHAKEYKQNFNKDFFINYFGEIQEYKNFVQKNNFELY